MDVLGRIILGLAFAVALSSAGYGLRALSRSGAFAAVVIGTVVLGAGGWTPAILLVLFFASSSLFSRLSSRVRPDVHAAFAKSSRRDARQVLANGALPACFSILIAAFPGAGWLTGVVGSLAAATADTWATEWGVLARRPPRRITDWKLVPAGTSGGVTPVGTLGSIFGALGIGAAAYLLEGSSRLLLAGLLAGLLGSAFDSVLGATVQVQYICSTCGKQTEQHPNHGTCGTQTSYSSGMRWVDNDVVNLAANLFGAVSALIWMS